MWGRCERGAGLLMAALHEEWGEGPESVLGSVPLGTACATTERAGWSTSWSFVSGGRSDVVGSSSLRAQCLMRARVAGG